MHSEVLIVARADRRPRIECLGGIAARSTLADTVHLISTAATPLGGDTINIRVIVEAGARLALRSAAATLALPSANTKTSHSSFDLQVAGSLDVDLEPTVVAADAVHLSKIDAAIDAAGTLRLRERVQIGRSDERQGLWSGALRADIKGQPLLRHRVEIGADAVADDVLSAPRACISELRYPAEEFETPPGSTVLELAAGGVLMTWQGDRLRA
ncbi:urease accessory protein UreD [soil metagenome]